MSVGQSIRKGITWLLVGNSGSQVLQFVFGILLARILVPADFGMVVTVQIFTGFVGMLTSGGMGQSLVRAKAVTDDDFNSVFTVQLVIGVVVFIGFFALAPWLAVYLEDLRYRDLIRVSAVSFLLRPYAQTRASWLNREMQLDKRAKVTLSSAALSGVTSIAMAYAGMGVWSLILAGLVGALAMNALYALATPLRLRLRFDRDAIRLHSGYGLKITTNEFLAYVKEQSVNLILSKIAGPAQLGLFSKADGLSRLPNRLITPPTGQTVFRAMSKVQDNLDQTKYMFYRTVALLTVYIGPALVGLWWVAEPLIEVLYGRRWLPAAEPMKVLILAAFLRPVRTPSAVVLAAQNRLGQEMVALAISLVLAIAASIAGLQWGLIGVAWALVADATFLAIYYYVLAYQVLPTRLMDLLKALAPGLLLSALVGLVLAGVHFGFAGRIKASLPIVYLGILGAAGLAVYVVGFFLFPIEVLRSESRRWRDAIGRALRIARRVLP